MPAARELETVARCTFRRLVPCFCESDRVEVDRAQHTVAVSYRTERQAAGGETEITLRLVPDKKEVWVRSIEVAAEHRRRGLGRQLASAAEQFAGEWGAARINAFPLAGADGFWRKLGYQPHPSMTRVLTKELPSFKRE